jgi:hypothetical protein
MISKLLEATAKKYGEERIETYKKEFKGLTLEAMDREIVCQMRRLQNLASTRNQGSGSLGSGWNRPLNPEPSACTNRRFCKRLK